MQQFDKFTASVKRLVFLWLPVFTWMGLIFYLSGRPELKAAEGPMDFWTRKPAHMVEYAILFLLSFRAMRESFSWKRRDVYVGAGALSFLYALTDELHQLSVPLREGKVVDLGFDLLGIVIAAFILHFIRRRA